MDELIKQGQWWWLISVPVLTGGFALGGSWWGSKLGKSTEHWQWLRNEKQKEYIAAADSMSAAIFALNELADGKPGNEISAHTAFITPIIVLGPQKVKKAMSAVMEDIGVCNRLLDEPLSEERAKRIWAALDVLSKNYDNFLVSIRRDLGVKE